MMRIVLICLSSVALLSACSEVDQSLAQRNQSDQQSWQGAKDPFVIKGWKAGDKSSWEGQMRARAQYQNEYAKAN
jgi:outer membrane biogenesis lipoprotein LolB